MRPFKRRYFKTDSKRLKERYTDKTVMMFLGLQVQDMKYALSSSYESHLDSSICSAEGC